MRPLRVCAESGCPELVKRGYCAEHRPKPNYPRRVDRPGGGEWIKLKRIIIHEQPFCGWPACNEVVQEIDHIVAISKGGEAWDRANLWGLCKTHHQLKTNLEQGWTGRQSQELQRSVLEGTDSILRTLSALPHRGGRTT